MGVTQGAVLCVQLENAEPSPVILVQTRDSIYRQYYYTSGEYYNASIKVIAEYEENDHNQRTMISSTHLDYAQYHSDKLTGIDNDSVTTDKVGNITAIGSRHFSWTNLRQLESITEGTDEYSYTYDENGIRTSKTVNGSKTDFYTNDGNIIVQTDGTNTWCFQYEGDEVIGFLYNDDQYFYIKNQMGDVIGIINYDGDIIADYCYDDFGGIYAVDKPNTNTSTENTIADTNPMLYRGYYYDYESGYYYLQSRYYDPAISRFISADSPDMMFTVKDEAYGGANSYSYCCNDPVNNYDPDGCYNRNNAVKYAYKWWLVPNINRFYYYDSGDCTNFVSQCLYAGGISMTDEWYGHYITYRRPIRWMCSNS